MPGIPEADKAALRAQAISTSGRRCSRPTANFSRSCAPSIARHPYHSGRRICRTERLLSGKIREFTTVDRDPAGFTSSVKRKSACVCTSRCSRHAGDGIYRRFPAFLKFLRTDPQFQAKTAAGTADARGLDRQKFDGKASHSSDCCRGPLCHSTVPDDLAPFYTAGRGGPGVFLVNTYDLPSRPSSISRRSPCTSPRRVMRSRCRSHSNTSISRNFASTPISRSMAKAGRCIARLLGLEMGMYETPYDRFGMLNYQIWRAARLVIDTGIHSQGWSRDRAIAYLHDYTALPEHEIETEVDRYISWPAQALSYYLGEDAIIRGRAKAESALGPAFQCSRLPRRGARARIGTPPGFGGAIDRLIGDGGRGPYPDLE